MMDRTMWSWRIQDSCLVAGDEMVETQPHSEGEVTTDRHRQTDRQTDRHTHAHTHAHVHTHTHTLVKQHVTLVELVNMLHW